MATRSPTAGTKSLRDRIAKFETIDVTAPKSPVSPRLKTTVTSRFAAITAGRASNGFTVSSQQEASGPQTPTIRSSAKTSGNDLKAVKTTGKTENTTIAEKTPAAQPTPSSATTAAPSVSPAIQPLAASVEESSSMQTMSSGSSSLDALLSPVASESQEVYTRHVMHDSTREEEDNDVRFSTIPLSGKSFDNDGKCQPSFASFSSGTPSIDESIPIEQDSSQPAEDDTTRTTVLKKAVNGEKKDSVSSMTSVPFLMNRIDKQEEELNDLSLGSNRQLQEEFTRIQNQKANAATEAEAQHIDWDFWGAVMADYHQFARENPDELARAIESGIPNSLRGMMWQLMSASKDLGLEAEYARLLKESSIHEKAIMRDLGRTFPHHDFFMDGQGIGQENLFNVLKAYSLYDPDVGYCQGLPFIVAILLLNMPDEEAFCLLVRLMATYGLRSHFLPEMPGLQLRLFQFDRLVEELLPVLHIHFLRQGVKSSMFCSQWFLTMFSYRFPLDVVFRIFDNVLATGVEAIFGFSLALLQKNEESLLALKFDDILDFLRNKLFDAYKIESRQDDPEYLVDVFVRDASLVRITPFMLDAYAHEYQDSVREREAHAVEMDTLRNTNRGLAAQVKSLEDSLGQLNTEHCDIVKQLVMARLENEEMEGELVRYKLLYADLMHKSEDAGSSHRLSSRSTSK